MICTGCGPGTAQVRDARDDSQYNDNGEFTRVDELGFEDETRRKREPVVRSDYKNSSERNTSHDRRDSQYNNQNERKVYAGSKREQSNTSRQGYFQKGAASWYGREFHGKVTASGDRFSMYEYTAAHKTLPFGSYIEVTNLKNGKTVTVKINDRGPYRGNRILDLSYTAAKQLNMLAAGEVPVRIVVLKKGNGERNFHANTARRNENIEPVVDDESYSRKNEYKSRSNTGYGGNVTVQAGAFFSRRNAEKLKSRVSGLTDRQVVVVNDGDLYKVRVKGLASRNEAEGLKRRLSDSDIKSFIAE